MSKSKVVWCNALFFPCRYGFCPDEEAWWRAVDDMNVKREDASYPTTDAMVTTFKRKGHPLTILVTVSEQVDTQDSVEVCGLFVHEAMHVWRHLREEIGEDEPSAEFEAYTMQFVFQKLLSAYQKTRNWNPTKKGR